MASADLLALETGVVDKYVHPPKLFYSVIDDFPTGSSKQLLYTSTWMRDWQTQPGTMSSNLNMNQVCAHSSRVHFGHEGAAGEFFDAGKRCPYSRTMQPGQTQTSVMHNAMHSGSCTIIAQSCPQKDGSWVGLLTCKMCFKQAATADMPAQGGSLMTAGPHC